jgi:aspartyl protease family protein
MKPPLSRFAPFPRGETTLVAWQSQFHGVRWLGPRQLRAVGAVLGAFSIQFRWATAIAALCLAPAWAHAQSVGIAGMLGSKALLVVDAPPPRAMGAGDELQGV